MAAPMKLPPLTGALVGRKCCSSALLLVEKAAAITTALTVTEQGDEELMMLSRRRWSRWSRSKRRVTAATHRTHSKKKTLMAMEKEEKFTVQGEALMRRRFSSTWTERRSWDGGLQRLLHLATGRGEDSNTATQRWWRWSRETEWCC